MLQERDMLHILHTAVARVCVVFTLELTLTTYFPNFIERPVMLELYGTLLQLVLGIGS